MSFFVSRYIYWNMTCSGNALKTDSGLFRGTHALLIAAAFMVPGAALAQTDADEKIHQLEQGIEAMNRQLEQIKGQVQDAKNKAALTEQRAQSQGVQYRFVDGVTFEDARGDWAVRASGRAQLDWRHYYPGGIVADTFSTRRLRLGLGATMYKRYSVYVEGDFASGDATGTTQQQSRATLAYLQATWGPPATLRLGQFKPQIGLEQTLLDLQSDFMERGLQQNILDGNGINYDRGIMLFGAPTPGTWYAVAVTNGTGQNLEEKQGNAQDISADTKDVTVRGVLDFAQMFAASDNIYHIGAGYKWGKQANSPTSPFAAPFARTEARGLTFFNAAAFNTTSGQASNIDRSMLAFELLLARGPTKLQAEYWIAEYAGTRAVPGPVVEYSPRINAGYVSAMWLITGESYADFYFDSYIRKIKPRNRFDWGPDSGMGAWEVGLRYSFLDASDFNSVNPVSTGQLAGTAAGVTPVVTTSANRATAYTAQVKWIQNAYTRVLLDYVRTNFETPVVANGQPYDHEAAVMMRFQVDF